MRHTAPLYHFDIFPWAEVKTTNLGPVHEKRSPLHSISDVSLVEGLGAHAAQPLNFGRPRIRVFAIDGPCTTKPLSCRSSTLVPNKDGARLHSNMLVREHCRSTELSPAVFRKVAKRHGWPGEDSLE